MLPPALPSCTDDTCMALRCSASVAKKKYGKEGAANPAGTCLHGAGTPWLDGAEGTPEPGLEAGRSAEGDFVDVWVPLEITSGGHAISSEQADNHHEDANAVPESNSPMPVGAKLHRAWSEMQSAQQDHSRKQKASDARPFGRWLDSHEQHRGPVAGGFAQLQTPEQ